MMFHTNDNADVEISRRWTGTNTIVAARAGIQNVHEVSMALGIVLINNAGNSVSGTFPSNMVRNPTIEAVKKGEKTP